jgi:N-acetylglucosaminyl-diphospho-decaprenol L-rhamnosyltransferase
MCELSIIVVNWNVCDLLESCLLSIEKNIGLQSEQFEVLIVDNHSADNSVEMVKSKFQHFKLIENEDNLGFARANNQAFLQCKGDFTLLLNPDTEIHEGAIPRMLAIMRETPDAGILGAKLINADGSFQRSSGGSLPTLYNVAWHYLFLNQIMPTKWAPPPTFLIEDLPGTKDIGWVSGAALMISREATGDSIFDDQFFMYGEDLELCDRTQRSGKRVMYTSEATVMHHLRQSLAKHTSEDILASAVKGNRGYFWIRHGRLKTWFYDLILATGYAIRWPCFALLSRLKSDPEYKQKLITSRRYAWVSFKSLFQGGP